MSRDLPLFIDSCNSFLNDNKPSLWQYNWIYHAGWEAALLLNKYPMATKGKHKDDFIYNKVDTIDEMIKRTYAIADFCRPQKPEQTPPYFAYVAERFILSEAYIGHGSNIGFIEVLHDLRLARDLTAQRMFEYILSSESYNTSTAREIEAKCPGAKYRFYLRYEVVVRGPDNKRGLKDGGVAFIFEDKEAVAYLEATRGADP